MALVSYSVSVGWFSSLVLTPVANLLLLPASLSLVSGDVLALQEVDALSVPTGRQVLGTVSTMPAAQFFNVPLGSVYLYFYPMQPAPWIDYSTASTIVGFSSFTVRRLQYSVIGDTVYVAYNLAGPGSGTVVSFTLPISSAASAPDCYAFCQVSNNSTSAVNPGRLALLAGASLVDFRLNNSGTAFSGTGTRSVRGVFFYRWR